MSYSQIGQDLWVLEKLDNKRNGYFVEFGAGNGTLNSNTCLLQKSYGWKGILAEPCKSVQNELHFSRYTGDGTEIWCGAVGPYNSQIETFRETPITELSTLAGYGMDHLASARVSYVEYSVQMVTLHTLLGSHNAPKEIDYLSIDTEGNEYDILLAFEKHFAEYNIKLITVEHNWTASRPKIKDLLIRNGYRLDKEVEWDDWYIKA